MDTDELRAALGDTGLAGAVLLCLGLAIVGRENRRAAVGAALAVAGVSLVGHGLAGSALESMGLSYEDL